MKNSTKSIYQQQANQVIDYISANLHLPLQLDCIADKINVSQRQLLRIMSSALNESLWTYVARQRVERAVLYMQIEKMNLTTLAEMVGYDNPQSFSKAFKKQFGISPKAYISALESRLESYVQSSNNSKDYTQSDICHFEGLELVYIRILGKYGEAETYEAAWNKLLLFLKYNEALTHETRFIGLSFDDPNVTDPNQCRFYACASVKQKVVPTGEFGTIRLQQGKYAVYTLRDNYAELQNMYNRISVSSEHRLRYGMCFEEYVSCANENGKENITKIYLPIK